MILSDFKRKNIRRKTNKHLKKRIKINTVFNAKIKTILLFVDENTNAKMLEVIRGELNVESSNSQIIFFKEKVEKDSNCESCITKKDFGVFGNFKNQEVIKTINQPIDLLISYVSNNTYLNNLVAKSNVNFKVGFIDESKDLYDMMIDVKKDDYTAFNNELKKYLKILNKI